MSKGIGFIALAVFTTTAAASAVTVENGGNQIVVGADYFTPGNLKSGTYYNPSGIVVGSKFHLYVQGGQFDRKTAPWRSCDGDQILLFSTPNTSAGLRSRFSPGTASNGANARISPCETDTGDGSDGNPSHTNSVIFTQKHHYTAGQVFYDGKYRMISAASNYPGATDFSTLILGSSIDGVQWHWEPFIRSTTGLGLSEVAFQAAPYGSVSCNPICYSHRTWWGFFNKTFSNTGMIKVDVSQQYPRGFRVWIYATDNTWKRVDDSSGDFSFTPKNVWPGVKVKAISYVVDHYELWATRYVAHNACPACATYNNGFAGTTFSYRTVDPSFTLGPVQSVYSQMRCLPSDSEVGRLYPFRFNSSGGLKLLYSATNDRNICTVCPTPGAPCNPFVGMYVVYTTVTN